MKKKRYMSKENVASLMKGVQQMVDHINGKVVPGIRITRVRRPISPEEVRNLRKSLNLTQGEFAQLTGEGISAVQSWEQSVRRPSGAAGKLLRFLEAHPEMALELYQA